MKIQPLVGRLAAATLALSLFAAPSLANRKPNAPPRHLRVGGKGVKTTTLAKQPSRGEQPDLQLVRVRNGQTTMTTIYTRRGDGSRKVETRGPSKDGVVRTRTGRMDAAED